MSAGTRTSLHTTAPAPASLQVAQLGLSTEGDRVEQLALLAEHKSSDDCEADGGSGGGSGSGAVPQALHALSKDALRSIAAARGLRLVRRS